MRAIDRSGRVVEFHVLRNILETNTSLNVRAYVRTGKTSGDIPVLSETTLSTISQLSSQHNTTFMDAIPTMSGSATSGPAANVPGGPLGTDDKVLEGGAAMIQVWPS